MSTRPRFTPVQRKQFRSRLREIVPHMTHAKAAELLNREGFKRPDGSAVNTLFVSNQVAHMGLRKFKRKGYTTNARSLAAKQAWARRQLAGEVKASKENLTTSSTDAALSRGQDATALAELVLRADIPKESKLQIISALI